MNDSSLTKPDPVYDDAHDSHLLRGIANGDRTNFGTLHERYRNLLYSVIFKVLNDHQDAEEVLQEVFFTLWRKAGLFHSSRGRPVTWLTSMARNRAIDRLRVKQRQARLRGACEEENSVSTTAFGSVPVSGPEAAERKDQCQAVRDAVIRLTPAQREAIQLSYFQGMTQKDIARHLQKPIGTVKARIRRGIHRLRDTIDSEL